MVLLIIFKVSSFLESMYLRMNCAHIGSMLGLLTELTQVRNVIKLKRFHPKTDQIG